MELSNVRLRLLECGPAGMRADITSTVENETRLVLEAAARQEIISSLDQFKLLFVVVNACEDRLDTILNYLLREPIDIAERGKYYAKVCELYDNWIEYGHELDVTESAYAKAGAVSKPMINNYLCPQCEHALRSGASIPILTLTS